MIKNQQRDTQPWWKEPWPWIIMAGPFLALVGCIITIALAVKYFSSEPIADGGVRQGLVVKRLNGNELPGSSDRVMGATPSADAVNTRQGG